MPNLPTPPYIPTGPVTTKAQWTWNFTTNTPVPSSYPNNVNGSVTKSGLLPSDLQNFVGIPLQYNSYTGAAPVPMTPLQLNQFIRSAEDYIEQETGILLCTTWVASPALQFDTLAASNNVIISASQSVSGQVKGIDYDLPDIGYDFLYRRWLMEGWGVTQLRYRPLQDVYYMSFIYPLLNQVFVIPDGWFVQDYDAAVLRIVPTANVQVLPLFALELTFTGFANSIPQALYLQYTAGLTAADYASRFQFMYTLILCQAAILALQSMQGTVNFGSTRYATSVDGLRYEVSYPKDGAAFSGIIQQFLKQREDQMALAKDAVRGILPLFSL
jgi:hypothetical protein